MKKYLLSIVCFSSLFLFSPCVADSNEEARSLYTEALRLMQGVRAETESAVKAFESYKAAEKAIDRISSDYPSSTISLGLLSGETKISGLTLAEFQQLDQPLNLLIDAEQDPLAFSRVIVTTVRHVDTNSRSGEKLLGHIAKEYAKSGEFSKALEIGNSTQDLETKASTLIQIAAEYTEAGKEEKSVQILAQALEMAKGIDDENAATLMLTDIALQYSLAGKKEDATRILTQSLDMSKSIEYGDTAGLMLEIANKYKAAGKKETVTQILTQAFNEAKRIKVVDGEGYAKVKVLADIAIWYMWSGEKSKAEEALVLALKTAKAERDAQQKIKLLALVAPVYFEFGEREKANNLVAQAIETAALIDDTNGRALMLAEIANRYGDEGYQTMAFRLLGPALDAANEIRYANDKANALIEVASAYAAVANREQAVQILSQAFETAKTVKDERKNRIFEVIAVRFGMYGQVDRSLEIAKKIEMSSRKEKALVSVATHYAGDEDFTAAVETANLIEGSARKAEALCNIAVQYAKAGKKQEALQLFAQSLVTTEALADRATRGSSIANCAGNYVEAGFVVEAFEAADLIEDIDEKSRALMVIADSFAENRLQPTPQDFVALRETVYSAYHLK